MRRGIYRGSESKSFESAAAEDRRRCFAVNEEDDNEVIKLVAQKSEYNAVKFEIISSVTKEAPKKRTEKSAINTTAIKSACKNAWDNTSKFFGKAYKNARLNTAKVFEKAYIKSKKAIGEYMELDNIAGREKVSGSFKYKCVSGIEKIRNYMNAEKNRSAVAFGGSVTLALAALLVVVLNFSVGFEAVVNGQSIGIVESKSVCENIVNDVNTMLVENFGEESKISADIVMIPRLVARGTYTDKIDVKNSICALSDKMHEMYVICLDDTQLCALTTQEEAQMVLDEFKNFYTGGREDVVFKTDKELVIRMQRAPLTLLRSPKEAVAVLRGSERKENEYKIAEGDTLWSISRKFDTSVDEILSINPGLEENIVLGDVISVKAYVPVVNVTTQQVKEYTEPIGYETQVVETDSMYRGKSEITQSGENGEVAVVASIVKENGLEVSREILSQTTIKEPVTRIKKVGTKEPPKGYGTGKFISPVYGTITSRYGYRRSGFHKGIDIANSYGTPIRAADNGIVIAAGWSGLFGKLVKIDHQNGYVTYYAHNSSFAVSVGDVVEKGQTIAYMGSTGNSTGNHCHFEIYKNGVLQNPDNYI